MRSIILLSAILINSAIKLKSQNDTLYLMKDGFIINKHSIKPIDLDSIKFNGTDTMLFLKNDIIINKQSINIDSIIFYQPTIADSGFFSDTRDSNTYKWIKIGNQIWMAENLRYLPSVVGPDMGSLSTPYYYVYGYYGTAVNVAITQPNYTTYGVLYNWTAAMDGAISSNSNPSGVQGVCPVGWHLPSDAEWTELTTYIGGESIAGGKLKETGTAHWNSPNTAATNETRFTALPGGYRYNNNTFYYINKYGLWWSTSESSSSNSYYRTMYYNYSNIYKSDEKKDLALSVRCIKD